MKSLPFAKPLLACALAFLAGGAGCDKKANQFVPPPPPSVTVARPAERSVTDYAEFTGTTQAVESVEIRARVEGFLQSIHFEAGAVVRKGDLLFVIDPKPFQAALAEAEANLKMAETDLKLAEDKLRRNQSLFARRAISNLELIESQSERDRDAAAIEVAKAQVRKARLNLQYTEVRAPIDGRAGRNLVDVGNLVGAGEPTLLTTVVKYDPMYVYFSVSERDLLAYQKKRETSKSSEDTDTFEMGLADDSGYPHAGRLDFLENQLDPDTGTILVRGAQAIGFALILTDGKPRMLLRVKNKTHQAVADREIGKDWTHVAGVLHGDGRMEVYINGEPAGSTKGVPLLTGDPPQASAGPGWMNGKAFAGSSRPARNRTPSRKVEA